MARVNVNPGLMPSLLDRMIDPESEGTAWQRGYSPRQMMEAVRRDLEDLFNTHQSELDIPEGYEEVRKSIVAYGLPDLPSIYAVAAERRQDIRQLIADVIARFEPRLRDVRVIMVESKEVERRVRFHIEARLNVEPSPEVAFETILELTTGQASILPGEA
jgi:type VI secretion system protein ImpF